MSLPSEVENSSFKGCPVNGPVGTLHGTSVWKTKILSSSAFHGEINTVGKT